MSVEKVIIVAKEEFLRKNVGQFLRRMRIDCAEVGTVQDAHDYLGKGNFDLMLLDEALPDGSGMEFLQEINLRPSKPLVVLMGESVDTGVTAMKEGAHDYLLKPFSNEQIQILIKKAGQFAQVVNVNQYLTQSETEDKENEMLGNCPATDQLRTMIRRVAQTEATVMIQGENGTGKELVARALHNLSPRKDGPFIKLNCAAMPENLVESELFGHERGAFTGAQQARKGLYETASGGSLFLDEIPELSKSAQVSMLRAAESGEFRRLGSDTPRAADVRLIAASALPLEDHVSQGSFREDLYFRLNGLEIHIPPLRERKDDIPALVSHFTEGIHHKGIRRTFSPPAITRLQEYDWPGNIRELRRAVERALVLCPHSEVRPDFVQQGKSPTTKIIFKEIRSMAEIDKEYILEVVRRKGGNLNAAARSLGISRSSLYRRLAEYGYKKGGEEEGRAKSEW